ncbi:MAG: hypothetical protein LBG48_04970 [Rickettsiales bacterium]|jgi:hypothetical protein|nr:hypothetical protein [Rickettsiales bacterium]
MNDIEVRNGQNYYNITSIKRLRSADCDIPKDWVFEEEEEEEDEDEDDGVEDEYSQQEEEGSMGNLVRRRKRPKIFYISAKSVKQYVKGKNINKIEDEGLRILDENIKTKNKPTKIFLNDPKKVSKNEGKDMVKYINKEKYQEIYLNVDFLSIKSNLELVAELNRKYLENVILKIKQERVEEEMEKIESIEKLRDQMLDLKSLKNLINPEFLSNVINNTAKVDFLKVGVFLEENYMEKIQNRLLGRVGEDLNKQIQQTEGLSLI